MLTLYFENIDFSASDNKDILATMLLDFPRIVFQKCIFKSLIATKQIFNATISFDECKFAGEVDFSESIFNKVVSFKNSSFHGKTLFINTVFKSTLEFFNNVKVMFSAVFNSTMLSLELRPLSLVGTLVLLAFLKI